MKSWRRPHSSKRSKHRSPIPKSDDGSKATSILLSAGLALTPAQSLEHTHIYLAPDGTLFGSAGYTHQMMANMAFPGPRRTETENEDKMIEAGFIRIFTWGTSVANAMIWYQPTSAQLASLEDVSVRTNIDINTDKGDFDYEGLKFFLEKGGRL